VKALSFEEYDRLSAAGGPVPVYREIPGDLLTPVSAFRAIEGRSERAFLLESVIGGERIARYSFLGRDPRLVLEVRGGEVFEDDGKGERRVPGDLLAALRQRLGPHSAEVPGLPRLTGGAVGYLSYDAIRLFERIPDRLGPSTIPVARFGLYRSLVAFDHVQQRLVLISDAEPGRRAAYERAQETLDQLEADLAAAHPLAALRDAPVADVPSSLGDGTSFRESILKAKEYIAAGDIFQVVLSRQKTFPCALPPFAVYRALRMVNPSPYMYFVKDGTSAIAGASPEMLVRVEGRHVDYRPIAGTHPRGATPEEDERLARQLLADEKERAEHVMLVDLGRNDVGRVSRFGSVRVPEQMVLERYSHVHHIVSAVVGDLDEGKDALDALVATFPAGTLTGAPKIRAMEIIDELEGARRGLYGGALGYIDLRGNLDFCIAIRTLVFGEGRVTLQTGAGIVADSDPVAEERETEAKAAALFEALRLAARL
jgi:anthranilate synthase component 1